MGAPGGRRSALLLALSALAPGWAWSAASTDGRTPAEAEEERKAETGEIAADRGRVDREDASDPWTPKTRPALPNERFLQHALGTQGDVRLPALLLSLAATVAVVAVAIRRWRQRRERRREG